MENLTLLTDLYQITMAYGYWKLGMENYEAVFHHTFRKNPFHGSYAIACGLANFIDFIENFHYSPSDIDYLRTLNLFDPLFLTYLSKLKLTISIDAMEEGTVCFASTPLVRVSGPLLQCQLLETALLNLMNFSTLIATKASRVVYAAKGDPVLEFGARRAQGVNGALNASRSAYIGGITATSNLLAGKLYHIPVGGTQAHSWVMAFDTEAESFNKYMDIWSENGVLLVDTYDTLQGVRNAIATGKPIKGIRLDSGDLALLSQAARKLLDGAGLNKTFIYASNELDEYAISDLKLKGAKIDFWGVGTSLATGKEQAALDGVYKLSALRPPGEAWKYKLKLSEDPLKSSTPGILQVRRFFDEGEAVADLIYDTLSGIPDPHPFSHYPFEELLKPIFRNGERIYTSPSTQEIRAKTMANLKTIPDPIKRFDNPNIYPIHLEKQLEAIQFHLRKR